MGKLKKHSLKWCFMIYIPICVIIAYLGSYIIGISTNYIQKWYVIEYLQEDFNDKPSYEIITDENGNLHYTFYEKEEFFSDNLKEHKLYWIISYAQVLLIPLWVFFCIISSGIIFYQKELEKPINTLFSASKKISENCLDFKIEVNGKNELCQLCQSFEDMRIALYKSNTDMWRILEERKRLNAAFSHDMRTPITVLKGYTDLLEKYIPDGKLSEEKLLEILKMMSNQITRLENYTHKMSTIQKLEDLFPKTENVLWEDLMCDCKKITDILTKNLKLCINDTTEEKYICIDKELVLEVYENLISNAIRYAENEINIEISLKENKLKIMVKDDGKGFSEETLKYAKEPFFREEKEKNSSHFGLGLYICKIICEKCQGSLTVENGEIGAKVTAEFLSVKNN